MNEQEFIRRMLSKGVQLSELQLKNEYRNYLKDPGSYQSLTQDAGGDSFLRGLTGTVSPSKTVAVPTGSQVKVKQQPAQEGTISPVELKVLWKDGKQAKAKLQYMQDDTIVPAETAGHDGFLDGLGVRPTKESVKDAVAASPASSAIIAGIKGALGSKANGLTAGGGRTSGGREVVVTDAHPFLDGNNDTFVPLVSQSPKQVDKQTLDRMIEEFAKSNGYSPFSGQLPVKKANQLPAIWQLKDFDLQKALEAAKNDTAVPGESAGRDGFLAGLGVQPQETANTADVADVAKPVESAIVAGIKGGLGAKAGDLKAGGGRTSGGREVNVTDTRPFLDGLDGGDTEKGGTTDKADKPDDGNDAIPISGPDGAPDENGINPKTGNYNIGGYDLTEQDLYALSNLLYTGYTPEQSILIFARLKQTDGNITGKELLDMGAVAEPNWFDNLVGSNPDGFASLLNASYRTAKKGLTFAEYDSQERQRRFNEAMGLAVMAAMSGEGLFGNSKTKDITGKSASDVFSDEIEKSSATRYTQSKTSPEIKGNGGVLDKGNYAQKKFGEIFSEEGQKALTRATGMPITTVDDLANAIKSGDIDIAQVPINYIIRDGNTIILNTRSSQALIRAGVPRSQWNAVNQTGDAFFEGLLTNQLRRNGLTSAGVQTVYPSKGGQ